MFLISFKMNFYTYFPLILLFKIFSYRPVCNLPLMFRSLRRVALSVIKINTEESSQSEVKYLIQLMNIVRTCPIIQKYMYLNKQRLYFILTNCVYFYTVRFGDFYQLLIRMIFSTTHSNTNRRILMNMCPFKPWCWSVKKILFLSTWIFYFIACSWPCSKK